MVFTKPLDVEDAKLTYFEIVEPSSLRYIFRARPARNFGTNFVSILGQVLQLKPFKVVVISLWKKDL